MSTIYLVCESTDGGHEFSGVYSVWSTGDAAIAEGERLMCEGLGRKIEIATATLDAPFTVQDGECPDPYINYAPPSLESFR